jgi:hypothetical protein
MNDYSLDDACARKYRFSGILKGFCRAWYSHDLESIGGEKPMDAENQELLNSLSQVSPGSRLASYGELQELAGFLIEVSTDPGYLVDAEPDRQRNGRVRVQRLHGKFVWHHVLTLLIRVMLHIARNSNR